MGQVSFAAIINDLYHRVASLGQEKSIAPPAQFSAFNRRIGDLMEQEARSFFEECPDGLFLVLDDAESLHRGKLRTELRLLCDLFRRKGWRAELGCPAETRWNGWQLLFDGQPVCFIVNRSTDFFWQSEDFSALRRAYEARQRYVAPDRFTYATRSDKRLLEWLSQVHWDRIWESAWRTSSLERPRAGNACGARRKSGNAGAKEARLGVQTPARIRRARATR